MSHRVLLVGDESSLIEGLRAARKSAYEVLTASSGSEALELMKTESVDVVVSDEGMEEMCGSELLRRVRTEFPDTARLILSGQEDLTAVVRAVNEAEIFRCLLKPCDPEELASSIADAIRALEARRHYDRWQEQVGEEHMDPETTIERALDTISMVFQPIFQCPGDSVYAYEALVRLGDPEVTDAGKLFGMASAIEYVPEVDATIRQAIARRIPEAPEDVLLFVNIHPDSLRDERIFSANDPLAPFAHRVVFELTERSSLISSDLLESGMGRLRDLGYRIALDDLGAGNTGLSGFSLMAPDVVKLDKSMIRGVNEDAARARLVESMTVVCSAMGIPTVAEGVETEEECKRIFELGCDLAQGYLLARPQPGFDTPKR